MDRADTRIDGRIRTRLQSLAVHAPALLLVAVAGIQLTTAHVADLSPWKGGGFGMFSTVDRPENRLLSIELQTAGARFTAVVPESMERLAQQARAVPSDRRLEVVAEAAFDRNWDDAGSPGGVPLVEALSSGAVSDGAVVPNRVAVEVSRLRVDPATGEVRVSPINRVEVDSGRVD